MNLNWFLSRTVRHAGQMRKHFWKILMAQRDLLPAPATDAVTKALQGVEDAVKGRSEKAAVEEQMVRLEKTANKWLKPYPFPGWRENIDVLLVAMAVALGIRTFFLQPFKIPTGSMQPTLYGITSNPNFKESFEPPADLRPTPDFEIRNPLARFLTYWYRGVSYTRVAAKSEGSIQAIEKPQRFLLFNLWQRFQVGEQWYTVWFPPDELLERAGLVARGQLNPRVFKPGEEIMKLRLISGDHLFVDRVSYNFRRPRRGDIIVFQTAGIDYPGVPRDQYYIKRLVGLGGEKLKIGADNHLRVNERRLDTNTPGFERVYSFTNDYVGHTPIMRFAGEQEFPIRPDHYIVMGDNTANSLDSRFFGDFSRQYVIGRAFCVYWPMGVQDRRAARFGWGIR